MKLTHILKRSILILLMFGLAPALTSCAPTIHKRKPLVPATGIPSLPKINSEVILYFEPVLDNKPFNETVWDNWSGPFRDIGESQQIGFDQNYAASTYSPYTTAFTTNTRIVVPFGRMLGDTCSRMIQEAATKSSVCYDPSCLKETPNNKPFILWIAIKKVHIAEAPQNHLNFYVKGTCEYTRPDGTMNKYDFEKKMPRREVATFWMHHGEVVDNLNKILNEFTVDLATDIFNHTLFEK